MLKVLSKITKCLFWVLILALLAAPLGLIYEISNREKREYVAPDPPVFVETAYGSIAAAERIDMKESVAVTGTFRSFSYRYMELTQREPALIRWEVAVGDEIREGQRLGLYQGEPVIADCSGLIAEIQAFNSSNAYLKIQQAEPVVLVCDVSPGTLLSLQYAKALSTQDSESVQLADVASIRNADGTTRVFLQISSDAYFLNQTVEEMYLDTGNVYLQTLVLPKACLYQKTAGEKEPWYVRQVTEDGVFLAEIEVGRGYANDKFVSVTGIAEGQFFDAGYGQFVKDGDTA